MNRPIDAIAAERHFLDHLAPIWRALPVESRGAFYTHPAYLNHARGLGVIATPWPVAVAQNPMLVASWGDTKNAMRANRAIARIEHGIGQSYAGVPGVDAASHWSYPGGRGAEHVGLFLTPNAHSAGRWQRAYPRARVEIIGSPRLDAIPAYVPEGEPIVAVSFHFDARGVAPETLPAFATYRDAVKALARTHRVIGHEHPRWYGEIQRWYRTAGIPFVQDLADVQRQAALYVCDNSSSLYEFAASGRPVVVLNLPGYRRQVNHGLRFWDAADVGIQVDRPAYLAAAVETALSDPADVRERREAALDVVYAHRAGAAQRAADVLVDWAVSLPARVAPVDRRALLLRTA